ncbi:restriction endonuclease [Streptomyces sp. NPDC005283]|uniref:restriction endonuclease n=1 Tax=Streptomyces sp. NPDC005283 TaxID=3156871 RepID=UPI00345190E9
MSIPPPGPSFREVEFTQFLIELLRKSGYTRTQSEVAVSGDRRVDIIAGSPDEILVIEVKGTSPQTPRRLRESVEQLRSYSSLVQSDADSGRPYRLILATPGNLTRDTREGLSRKGITLWDGRLLAQMSAAVGLEAEASRFLSDEHFSEMPRSQQPDFAEQLAQISPGRAAWSAYQRLCRQIAEYLFCPPLRLAIWESTNEAEVNKRDFILPNYSTEGFWKFLRDEYRAHYVVVDAKNYQEGIEKEQVLQIANYLSHHGTGLFALIMTRNEAKQSALYTMREQWILHNKMIVVLQDRDILQMLTDKSFGNDPAELVRQKIEDFRLGL